MIKNVIDELNVITEDVSIDEEISLQERVDKQISKLQIKGEIKVYQDDLCDFIRVCMKSGMSITLSPITNQLLLVTI